MKNFSKSKIGSKGFNFTKNWFHSTEISNQSCFFLRIKFTCYDNITARNSKLNFNRCGGGLSTGVAIIFMRGDRKSDIMDFLY